jgi:hypothetical protein
MIHPRLLLQTNGSLATVDPLALFWSGDNLEALLLTFALSCANEHPTIITKACLFS